MWACIRQEDGLQFAKKKLINDEPGAVKRFQREVRILSKLDHPRIVKVVGVHLSQPPYWYVMPFYTKSLEGCFPEIVKDEPRIASVFGAILDGMEYAHAEEVIHRDLKPANILLNDDNDVVITDFGLGRDLDAKTTRATYTGDRMGTPWYMAPEQSIDAKSVDQRSDIFALGRILYKLYTDEPPNAVQDTSQLPLGIALIVERCTKKNPDDRFQTVSEIRTAFNLLLEAHSESDIRGRIENIISSVVARGRFELKEAEELTDLVVKITSDVDLVHEICVNLPRHAFKTLWEVNQTVTRLIIRLFIENITSQSWNFSYVDVIANVLVHIYEAVPDITMRAQLLVALADVAVGHNRFNAIQKTANILQSIQDPSEGLAVVHAFRNFSQLRTLEEYLTVTSIKDRNIRALFLEKKARD